jgi:hypothetical protein
MWSRSCSKSLFPIPLFVPICSGREIRPNRRDRDGFGAARPRGWEVRKQIAPQVLEKARFAEENGSRREVDTNVRIFFKLQKNEVKRLKSLSRAQNRPLTLAVDR